MKYKKQLWDIQRIDNSKYNSGWEYRPSYDGESIKKMEISKIITEMETKRDEEKKIIEVGNKKFIRIYCKIFENNMLKFENNILFMLEELRLKTFDKVLLKTEKLNKKTYIDGKYTLLKLFVVDFYVSKIRYDKYMILENLKE